MSSLSATAPTELPANRILWRNRECAAEGSVREPDGEVALAHEQAIADRFQQTQRVEFAHCSRSIHLLMTGFIRSTARIRSCQIARVTRLPVLIVHELRVVVGNLHYRRGGKFILSGYVAGSR